MRRFFLLRVGLVMISLSLFAIGCTQPVTRPPAPPRPVACTLEAKLCPDGSAVGRVGPNCEFAPCPATPSSTMSGGNVCKGVGDTSCPAGTQCIQDCGPPVVRIGEPPPPYHCVDNATASRPRMCPICLASNTRIATPAGEVNVREVKLGMSVWSLDAKGNKVVSKVIRVSRTAVPSTHQVVHLVLSDKREVWVSPGHPTVSGRLVGDLKRGDAYDQATIMSAELVPYWDNYTYDLLTDSATSAYWANGILLGSTLASATASF